MNDLSPIETQILRVPPHSLEAEQSVLGGLMLANDAWDRIGDLLEVEDFYRHDHRLIYGHVAKLIEANKPADVLTIVESLRNAGELDQMGGMPYIHSLAENTPSAANIRRYAEIVRERSILRKTIAGAMSIEAACWEPKGKTAMQILDEAQASMLAIADTQARVNRPERGMASLLTEVMQEIDKRAQNPGSLAGKSTGFIDLDAQTEGFQDGDLIIVAGRPSMGKTSFALNIAEHVAVTDKLPVLVFSMEMGGTQIAQRLLGTRSRVPMQRLKSGRLDQRDWDRMGTAMANLNDAPIEVDDSAALSVGEVRARSRRVHRKYGRLGMIIVDYLQLMRTNGEENRATELAEISRGLKNLARELHIPVVALSQLNRSLEQRVNKRPVMSDLRESGAIEQDADVILFVYRDEVYNEDSPDRGTAEIIISKQRNGPIGKVRLAFLNELTRFENFSGFPEPRPTRPRAHRGMED